VFTIAAYLLCAAALAVSLARSRQKTWLALKKSWKAFENILPQFLAVLILVGMLLAVFQPETVSLLLGRRSGWPGVLLAAAVGAITLIPGFVAFPMAAMILAGGAGAMQVGAFVSTLMMVGVLTLPIEVQYFGRKLAFLRNLLAFLFSFLVAWAISLAVPS
jgi:uncharacterized membrane protein YraQ (UPF0718 family)